jgi:protein phosphatase
MDLAGRRPSDFRPLFEAYMSFFTEDGAFLSCPGHRISLPEFSPETFLRLFAHVRELFKAEPVLLEVSSPCVVVGDIHGHIGDLARILTTFGRPSEQRYVFLGDLVDRGCFSLECVVVVFLMKAIAPAHVFLIRGNHEFEVICGQGGFLTQVVEAFGTAAVFQAAVSAFASMPLAGVVDGSILCVHGGLAPGMTSLQQIQAIERPIADFSDRLVEGLLWSDPSPDVDDFEPSNTRRVGSRFGERAAAAFLAANRLKMIVRAHECVADGCRESFNGAVVTVFTASNYCGTSGNQGGALQILIVGTTNIRRFPPLPWRTRKDVAIRPPSWSPSLPTAETLPPRKAAAAVSHQAFVLRPVVSRSSLLLPQLRRLTT